MGQLWETIYQPQLEAARADPDKPESRQFLRVQRSAQWLADNFAQVPLFLFPFAQHDPSGGSIFPAIWSAMLAARAEGIGSCITALLQFFHPAETLEILGVPADQGWILAATVSFGYADRDVGGRPAASRRPGLLPQHVGRATSGSRCPSLCGIPERRGCRRPHRPSWRRSPAPSSAWPSGRVIGSTSARPS